MVRTHARSALAAAAMCMAGTAAAQVPASTASPPPPATVTLTTPGMGGALAFPASPTSLDAGVLGTWYVDGVLSGLAMAQSGAASGDRAALADISNGQIVIQKIDGVVQFYAQVGAYALPTLGTPYGRLTDAGNALGHFFSALPQAFLKIEPTEFFSIEAGKLPTLIGEEYTFDFENPDIERGLLWNQEPAVSRGVQANATVGPVVLSVSLNDGYYAGRYSWVSGSATWIASPTSTLVFAAGGNMAKTGYSAVATPLALNNGTIYDLIYSYNRAKLTVTPYVQYSHVGADPSIGITRTARAYGGAVIANYAFTRSYQLAARAEYIRTNGGSNGIAPTNLLYGAGSGAFSFTLTPTFTCKRFFLRAEASLVAVQHLQAGDGFGREGDGDTQIRGLLETGVVF
jgi:hypothetical protein